MDTRHIIGSALFASLALYAASAQTLHVPMGYMWGAYIPSGLDNAANSYITPMVHINLGDSLLFDGVWRDLRDTPGAYIAGRYAARRVWEMALPQGRVCISLQNWGEDDNTCDSPQYSPDPQHDCFFFRDADRVLSKDLEWEDPPNGFPHNRNDFDGRTARYYRHPFLINAGGNPNAPQRPLRDWTRQFLRGYQDEKLAYASQGMTIPRPDVFAFDVEPLLNIVNNSNGIYMLQKIAQSDRWNWVVPGYNASLADLYNARVGDGVFNWPADVTTVIDPSLSESRDVNSPYSVWWNEICFRALNEVMRVCAYEPIHDPEYGWPEVRCCNYRDMNADGLSSFGSTTERVGWFQDRPVHDHPPDTAWHEFPRQYGTESVARDSLPRFQMHPLYGGYQFWAGGTQRYLGFRQWSSGQADSPVLYTTSPDQFTYVQQKDYYLPGNPLDATAWHATRRIMRRAVETALNSGGSPSRLVPWLQMSSTDDSTQESRQDGTFYSKRHLRDQLRMLRAKNVQDLLFWTNQPAAGAEDNLIHAWDETPRCIQGVYAGHIVSYARATGLQVNPGVEPVDPSRLEFTLPDPSQPNHQDYEVEVGAKARLMGSQQYQYTTALVVDILWDNLDTQTIGTSTFDYEVEASVQVSDPSLVTGRLWYWNQDAHAYVLSQSTGCSHEPATYTLNAPRTASDGRYRLRVSFPEYTGSMWLDGATGKYKSRIKLEHTTGTTTAQTFISWFDLVQQTPVLSTGCPQGGASQLVAAADVNQDGVVDSLDVVEFVGDWMDNDSAADLSLDGVVDDGDVEQFLDEYAAGG